MMIKWLIKRKLIRPITLLAGAGLGQVVAMMTEVTWLWNAVIVVAGAMISERILGGLIRKVWTGF